MRTSGGKYIAPGQIAAQFKGDLVVGLQPGRAGQRSELRLALISLDPREAWRTSRQSRGLSGDFETASQSLEVRRRSTDIDGLNSQLNRWGDDQKFTILPRDLSGRKAS